MKRIFTLLLGISVLGSALPAHAIRETGGLRAPSAIEVTFISIGAGIDFDLKDQVLALAAEDEAAGKLVQQTQKLWGFEGETTLCIEYKRFTDVFSMEAKVQNLLSASKKRLTSYKLTESCDPNSDSAPLLNE